MQFFVPALVNELRVVNYSNQIDIGITQILYIFADFNDRISLVLIQGEIYIAQAALSIHRDIGTCGHLLVRLDSFALNAHDGVADEHLMR